MIVAVLLAAVSVVCVLLAGMAYESYHNRVALVMLAVGIATLIGHSYLMSA